VGHVIVARGQTEDPDQLTTALKNPKFLGTPSESTIGFVNRSGQLAWLQADRRTFVLFPSCEPRVFRFSDQMIQCSAIFFFGHFAQVDFLAGFFPVPPVPRDSTSFPGIRIPFALGDHLHDSARKSFNGNFHFILLVHYSSPGEALSD